jgi:hypothetical protein
MEKKQSNIYLAGGLIINLILIGFFVIMFFNSIPKDTDLKKIPDPVKPQVYDANLEKELYALKKVGNLPINIIPGEIGKQNPYNY